ncbi:hypothetical protein GCM10011322_21350 [Salinarimonas ramus]|uniref:RES domain-containing protein n=1 Tax=Salinarimonas ramus TaxID=690164 RepID=A0A917Q806_9HYPH|nr:RES family NAD+ phosphorylase [Salinarimonas ramus]GGK34351.1 hypothetical protein GCM10011322_21350 [Salinarimonas ramus]
MPIAQPPHGFEQRRVLTSEIPKGRRYRRIYRSEFPDPLGYAKSPSRFSDPRALSDDDRFGVVYFNETSTSCFLEAVLRDRRDGILGRALLDEEDLTQRSIATIEIVETLSVLDLRGDAPVRMGVPSEVVRGYDHRNAHLWAVAFHEHASTLDGIVYPSRLDLSPNLAIYDRAIGKVRVLEVSPLIEDPDMPYILERFDIALTS